MMLNIFSFRHSDVFKTYLLTDLDENGELIDITTVRINLSAMSDRNERFGIMDISLEIAKEIHHQGTLIILHKSGTAVSDSSATKGK